MVVATETHPFRGRWLALGHAGIDELVPQARGLGAAQWRWLEEQLKVPAELRLIGSGVQVVPDEHGSEMWGNFPLERKRLFKLIKDTGANGVVFLTGDRHLAEISKLPADHPLGVGYPLFEVCSSSLNTPSGNFTKTKVRFANETNSNRVGLTYFDVNFVTVLVDGDAAGPVVRLQVREESGQVVLQQRVTLSLLSAQATASWDGQRCWPARPSVCSRFSAKTT